MQKWWDAIRYFKPEEFESKQFVGGKWVRLPGSGQLMDRLFVWKLDGIRHAWGGPLSINSGYRTEEHNENVGGAANSGHRHGRAADVNTKGWTFDKVRRFQRLCREYGMTGFGEGNNFVHIDDLTSTEGVSRPLMWDYKNGKAGNYRLWG
jgi:zinc D-Ala-D-Ala carboxypeptidase